MGAALYKGREVAVVGVGWGVAGVGEDKGLVQ